MEKKLLAWYIVFLFILSMIPLNANIVSGDPFPYGGNVVGDTVYWENSYANLSVYPHTSNEIIRQKQYANLTWKESDNSIDVAFRFDDPLLYGKIWRWTGDGWTQITMQHITYNEKHYYCYVGFNVVQDTTYRFKWEYDVPANTTGKWDLFAKLNEHTIQQALDNDWYIALDPWWDSAWDYKREITINHAYIDTDLTNFTVLTNLSAAISVNCDGGDSVRFVDDSNTVELKHDLDETWDAGSSNVVWVKIPFISSSYDTKFYVYYGNSGASDSQSRDTWDTNYLGVYHLNQSAGIVCYDSTSNANEGSYNGSLPTRVDGRIGYGQDFDGVNDWIFLPSGCYLGAGGTVEVWSEADATDTDYRLYTQASSWVWEYEYFAMGFYGSVDKLFSPGHTMGTDEWLIYPAWTLDTNYHYYALGMATNDIVMYEDMITVGTDTSATLPAGGSSNILIGLDGAYNYDMDGIIDEIRVSDIKRNASWLNASYHTVYSSDFSTMGLETEETDLNPGEHGTHVFPLIADGEHIDLTNYFEENWYCVNEGTTDYFVWTYGAGSTSYLYDIYEMADRTSQAGDINNVTILVQCVPSGYGDGKIAVKTHSMVYYDNPFPIDSPDEAVTDTWLMTTNPYTGATWTWDEIDAMQPGIALKTDELVDSVMCYNLNVTVAYNSIFEVTTDAPSNVEETTATISGSIITPVNNMTCGFWYNNVTTTAAAPGTNITLSGYFDSGETFTENITGLLPGEYYYVRAWSHKIVADYNFTTDTTEQYFLTKPYAPSTFYTSLSENNITLTWNNATVSVNNRSNYIRYKATGYPTSVTDGTLFFNDSTTNSTSLSWYTPSTSYYFSVWTYINESGSPSLYRFSDNYNTSYILTDPRPTSLSVPSYNDTEINLTWVKGTGDTVIVRNSTHYPSDHTDGTEAYNGSLQAYTDSGLTPSIYYYYRAWDFDGSSFSSGYTNVSQVTEPQPPQNIVSSASLVGDASADLTFTWDNGTGSNRTVIRRSYTSQPVNPTDGTEIYNSTLNTTTDSSITQSAFYTAFSYNTTTGLFSDAVIIEWFIVWINCYNESSGNLIVNYTVFFTNEEGTDTYSEYVTSNPCLVNTSDIPTGDNVALQVNATGYRTRIYYFDIDPTGIFYIDVYLAPDTDDNVTLYLISIIDENDVTVEDVKIKILRFINGSFVNITILMSDANGQADVFLYPSEIYKVNLSKTGYKTRTDDWIPSDSIYTKTFKIYFEELEFQDETDCDATIRFSVEQTGTSLYVNYTDSLSETINTTIYIYEQNHSTGNTSLYATHTNSSTSTIRLTVSINSSNTYIVTIFYSHTTCGDSATTRVAEGHPPGYTDTTTPGRVLTLFNAMYGTNPFGWQNVIGLGIVLVCLFSFGARNSGIGLMLCGGTLLFVNAFIGLTAIAISLSTIYLALGVLMQWHNSRREGG